MPTPISLREYARHRKALGLAGGSAQAVSQAVKKGRLPQSAVLVDGVPKIADAALADREWASNTDVSRAPIDVKERASRAVGVAVSTELAVVSIDGDGPLTEQPELPLGSAVPLAESAAREKAAKANLAELDYLERAGRLVDAAEVEAGYGDLVSATRGAMLAIPSKFKGAVPHLTHQEMAILHDLICKALNAMADWRRPTPTQQKGAAA